MTLANSIFVGVCVGACFFTGFVIAWPIWGRGAWKRAVAGWALMVSSTATALLLDLTVLFHWWTPPDQLGLWVTLAVVWLIALGGCLKCTALVYEMCYDHPWAIRLRGWVTIGVLRHLQRLTLRGRRDTRRGLPDD